MVWVTVFHKTHICSDDDMNLFWSTKVNMLYESEKKVKVTWHVAKYAYPYSEFVLIAYIINEHIYYKYIFFNSIIITYNYLHDGHCLFYF